jgi:hypothetical protein
MLTVADVKSLPKPTDSQWLAFEKHLVGVHSWYKHLPLFGGGDFVVFLAPDAGVNYPTQHPRLPIENTSESYRRAFGHLDYMWRIPPEESFCRDGSPTILLDNELMRVGRFNLYPYISEEFYWSVHEEAIARIQKGDKHTHAAEIIKAYDADLQLEQLWENLTDLEQDIIDSINNDEETSIQKDLLSISTLQYLELQDCYTNLRGKELIKLNAALNHFRYWLE